VRNIIFVAPPAAGKGVQSELLKNKYGLAHISTGDLLREEVKSGSALGQDLDSIMKQGTLVSDDIITELLKKRLQKADIKNGYILDGYPRTIEQAKKYEMLLEELHIDLGDVIFLDISEDIALKRITGRISCPKCGISYNRHFEELKPKVENICNKCQGNLESRIDDNEVTFRTRYQTYLSKTSTLLHYYEDKGVLHTIKITEETKPMDVFGEIEKIINH